MGLVLVSHSGDAAAGRARSHHGGVVRLVGLWLETCIHIAVKTCSHLAVIVRSLASGMLGVVVMPTGVMTRDGVGIFPMRDMHVFGGSVLRYDVANVHVRNVLIGVLRGRLGTGAGMLRRCRFTLFGGHVVMQTRTAG